MQTFNHYALVECRPRVLKVVQGCGFRPGHRLPHTMMLPVHHVHHEPEHCHVLPAYPEVHHHDVVLHYGLPGGEACAAHHHHHGGTLHSVPGCGCHPHGHHHKHGCGCAKEF